MSDRIERAVEMLAEELRDAAVTEWTKLGFRPSDRLIEELMELISNSLKLGR